MTTVPFRGRRADPDRALPHNLDAERAVLGALLLDNSNLEKILGIVSAEDFFLPQHQAIFRAIAELIQSGKQATAVTVLDALERLDERATAQNLTPVISKVLDGAYHAGAVVHGEIVRRKALHRQRIYAAEAIANAADDPQLGVTEFFAGVEENLNALRVRAGTNGKQNGKPSRPLLEFLAAEFPPPEHLVENIIPRGGTVLIYALPHHLKSWLAAALALAATAPGQVLGALTVNKPVRTILAQVEDPSSIFQWRIKQLLKSASFQRCDPANLRVIDTSTFRPGDPQWFERLRHDIEEFGADLLILDVLRRIIYPRDVNSPKETAEFLEMLEGVRAGTGCAVALIHHANKKELMSLLTGAAGSYNLMGWANVVIGFKQKRDEGQTSHVTIEIDNKFSCSPEPMRMTLDLSSSDPVRITPGTDELSLTELRDRLSDTWTVRDLIEVAEMSRASAYRWLRRNSENIEKLSGTGKGGRGHQGLARYQFRQGSFDLPSQKPVSASEHS
jgi:AAA domain/DnaB-like helicase N terminal domain